MSSKNNICAAALLAFSVSLAHGAEAFPNRPLRILVGFTPGSGTDFLARTVGSKLSEAWAQPVVVDNRPGAGGVIASELLKRSAPDGHTLMVVSNGHAVNASLMAKLPYDTLKDFAGVTYVADVPNVLVIMPALKLRSVKELIDLMKARPGQINYGSAGIGTSTHVNGELFKLAAGINVVHIPYKGSPEAISNTLGGSVHYSFNPISTVAPLVTAGKLNALAVSTKNRSPVLPNVPSIAESGLPGFDFAGWYALFAPAATPRAVRVRISEETTRILGLPEVHERLLTQGATAAPSSPDRLDAFMRDEVARMAQVVKAAGMRQD
jgi:tripartite-type tricarboxylate transporter receptor subunit TctC